MYGKYNTNKEESISSKKEIKINLVIIYIFLLLCVWIPSFHDARVWGGVLPARPRTK